LSSGHRDIPPQIDQTSPPETNQSDREGWGERAV
jgi:hypothetical protein